MLAPTLTDGTVTLRAHSDADVQGCFEQCQDPLSQQWTTVPIPYSRDDAKRFVRHIMPGGWETGQEWGFAVEVDGRYAGTVSLRPEGEARAEIAYGSHPWVRGLGHLEAALRLLLGWGFSEQGLETVIWWSNRGNWASRRLAWKLGFTVEGTLRHWLPQRGELLDAWVGTLLRDDARSPATPWLGVPTLESDVVRLRPWRPSDTARLLEAANDARTQHWLASLPHPYTERDAADWLLACTAASATGRGVAWALADPVDDRLVGSLNLFDLTSGEDAEIGYWVHPDARSRGVATRAVRLALAHAFGELGLQRVQAHAALDNAASRHVLESAGLRQMGIRRRGTQVGGHRVDAALYDLLREEWDATHV